MVAHTIHASHTPCDVLAGMDYEFDCRRIDALRLVAEFTMRESATMSNAMRHSKHIIGWLVTLAAFAWCIFEWGFADEGPAYFAADRRRIVAVAVFSIAGGLLVYFIMQLPEAVRHRVGAIVFGTLALLAAGGCIWIIWQFFRLHEFISEARILWWVAPAELGMCLLVGGLSVCLWRHFRKSHGHRGVP